MKPTTASQNFEDSTLHGGLAPAGGVSATPFVPRASLFDACHVGVVLRVVLFVQAVVGVGAMFGAPEPLDWLLRFSLLTGGVLPATLAWLIAVCAFKGWLNRLAASYQWLVGMLLGTLAGLYGCGLLALMGLLQPAQWWASGAAGALLSAMVLAGLFWRAKARTPAATAARLAELQSRIRPHFLFNTL
ncbi:MAG: sensor histidine kinase, partial [Polaromonas sp.]